MTIDPTKLLIVAVVALIVLGPEKLPTVLRQLGRYWSTFRSVRETIQQEMGATLSSITEPGATVRREATEQITQIRSAFEVFRNPFGPPPLVGPGDRTLRTEDPMRGDAASRGMTGGSYEGTSFPGRQSPEGGGLGAAGSSAYLPGSPELN
jgi:sec-independent protein translocase protein TatB